MFCFDRKRCNRFWRVFTHDGEKTRGVLRSGRGTTGGVPSFRQGRERLHQQGGTSSGDEQPGGETDGRRDRRHDQRGGRRRRRPGQLPRWERERARERERERERAREREIQNSYISINRIRIVTSQSTE